MRDEEKREMLRWVNRPYVVPRIIGLLMVLVSVIGLLVMCCPSKAAEPVVPQVRAGVHAGIPFNQSGNIKLSAHVILANLVQGGDTFAYAGPLFELGPTTKVEVMFGGSFKKAGHSPIVSPRLIVDHPKFTLWVDLEYAPLSGHNIYNYVDFKFKLQWFRVGVDVENWVNLNDPQGFHLSAGPGVGAQFGDHVGLGLTWFFCTDAPRTFPRLYVHLFF